MLSKYLNLVFQSQSTEEMKTEVGEDEEEIKENHEDDLKTLPSPEEQGQARLMFNISHVM